MLDSIDALPRDLRVALGVGVFDGVHRGHVRFLRALTETARRSDAISVVVTFDPHPQAVITGRSPALLCDVEERVARVTAAGVDIVVVQRFDRRLSELSAEQFLNRVRNGCDLTALVMASGAAFGHGRSGTVAALREVARTDGFLVVEVPPLQTRGERVSSSRTRAEVAEGRLAEARRLLGRHHAVRGEVVHGDGRGRALGFPTANLAFPGPVALPPDGIYTALVSWGGADPLAPTRRAQAVVSLGVRPTFGEGERVLEAHLLDFDELLYGERLRVAFLRRQRGQRRFRDVDALVAQMGRDIERAREILDRPARNPASHRAPC